MAAGDQAASTPSRRVVLAALGTVGVAGAVGLGASGAAQAAAAKPKIRPRTDWANQPATGPLPVEAKGDVKFLIVHHSETSNDYARDRVPAVLRSMYNFHTGEKGWNDIAYNFLVDKYGTIWEGRTGSLSKPVKGSATGGSQGFSQIVCLIGNHTKVAPTAAAQKSLIALLAWLAGQYSINLWAGKTITFTSRGSNKWPKGTKVTTDPIVGHRDMSQTSCPGDTCYPLVRNAFLPGAIALTPAVVRSTQATAKPTRRPAASQPANTATASPSPASPSSASPSSASAKSQSSPQSSSTTTSAAAAPATGASADQATAIGPPMDETAQIKNEPGVPWTPIAVGGAAAAAVAAGAVASMMGRPRDVPDLHADPLDRRQD